MMRMNMVAETPIGQRNGPLSLTLRTHGTRDIFECQTDYKSLVQLLGRESGLSTYAVDLFFNRLRVVRKAPLYGVRLSDTTLQKLGFFVD